MTADREPAVGETHYAVLGVPRDAARPQIARAYRAAMRRLHPDAVGAVDAADDEVFAVQEAWRILGDPEARAAYDDELSGPADAWSDIGWGVTLDDPEPTADDGAGSAPSPTDSRPRPDVNHGRGEPDDGPDPEPWRTPFAPGAVRVPEPVLTSGPPARGPVDWLLIVSATVLTSVTVVAGARGRTSIVVTDAMPGISVTNAAIWFTLILLALAGGIVGALGQERGSDGRAAAFGVTSVLALCAAVIPFGLGLAATLLGVAAFGALAAVFLAVSRRWIALRRAETDQANRLTAYHRAVEWNRIREALREPGSRVERSHGPSCIDEPLRVRTEDPLTGETKVRDLDVSLPRGAWVVVDDIGSMLCTAPPGALEAWLATWPEARTRGHGGG